MPTGDALSPPYRCQVLQGPLLTHQGHPDGQSCPVDAEVLQDIVAHKAQD